MSTPFTHLEIAQRLLVDPQLPESVRDLLNAECGAFLLGSVAADARIGAGVGRHITHFYSYDTLFTEHAWKVMFKQHPVLQISTSPAQRAFLAGYVGHLAVDESWLLELVRPQFAEKKWDVPRHELFIALHLILIYLDQRDLALLKNWQSQALLSAAPDHWLPFMPDEVLSDWRDFIGKQIAPGGKSQTVAIFAERVMLDPKDLGAIANSPEQMQQRLWRHVPKEELARAETAMYRFTRQQIADYFSQY